MRTPTLRLRLTLVYTAVAVGVGLVLHRTERGEDDVVLARVRDRHPGQQRAGLLEGPVDEHQRQQEQQQAHRQRHGAVDEGEAQPQGGALAGHGSGSPSR